MPVQEPRSPDPEVAFVDSSREDVQTIVTNNFIRYCENNQVVMTGDARVVNIREGIYTAADLSKKWLDNNSSGGPIINPEHIKIVKNVQWRHKLLISPSAEAGDLIFPADFDGNLPTLVATAENLKYYGELNIHSLDSFATVLIVASLPISLFPTGCSFADGAQVKVSLSIEHKTRDYTYNPNYVQDWVLGKNGPGLERHDFTQLDMPDSTDNGWFVLGKFNDQEETELHLTAFKIPQKQTLLIPPYVIHSNDYLQGKWRTMLADADIDRVKLKRQRHSGMALQPFVFDFPVMNTISTLISNDGDIDVAELLQKVRSYHAVPIDNDWLETKGTFVELLIAEKYLGNWRSQYERPLQITIANIKQKAIDCTNVIKRCEAEQLQIEKRSPPGPDVATKRSDIATRLSDAKSKFATIHNEIEKLEKKLMNIDLTVGLFLDEIMATTNFNPTLFGTQNHRQIIDRLAVCFVNLMNRGIALHILRGRPLQCKSPLLTKTIQIAGANARSVPCVVSVIGEQSSAKSSLLNTCFGTNFRVSSGRCTIGIYVSVVHWAKLTVVLLDTEGLLSVEEASALFDNQIVTMAMLSSHLTIINHKGEFSTTLSSLIGMSLYAKAQIQSAMKPALLFILRDQSDTTDEAKRKHFLPQLRSLKQTLQTDAKFLTTSIDDVMEISPNAVMLLPNALVKDVDAIMGIE
ncbi:unnamed protein product [Didymodactylos carnosus]|uniref:VLIG-type G domain-containing protein n=1 Tax=Didymodactylos carnosus TaxID=1234261 RepID=A0A8S2HT79_9BILA|nr:unnamed protein product [Didymodactylos carnosus]CAF3675409.1 unnamed protein product [Didymodactylos carnosus]